MPYKEAHDIIYCYKYFRMRTPGHVIYVGVDIRCVVVHVMNLISTLLYIYSGLTNSLGMREQKHSMCKVMHNLGGPPAVTLKQEPR